MPSVTKPTRKPWTDFHMDAARLMAMRGTCERKQVGAVIVRDNRLIASGYNGSLPGEPHCSEVGCMMEDGHCVRTIHAEANAILQGARYGISLHGTTLYTTASPCWPCFKQIATVGIDKIVFGEIYRDPRIFEFAARANIELMDMSPPSD